MMKVGFLLTLSILCLSLLSVEGRKIGKRNGKQGDRKERSQAVKKRVWHEQSQRRDVVTTHSLWDRRNPQNCVQRLTPHSAFALLEKTHLRRTVSLSRRSGSLNVELVILNGLLKKMKQKKKVRKEKRK